MNKKLVKVLSLALVAIMIFAMSATFAVAAEESDVITNSLGTYPYPYPTAGERPYYVGWNQRDNAVNSVWYNDAEETFYNTKAATDGYTDGNGVHHPYGVGMHSAILNAPSTVYRIEEFKLTSFKTTVFLVQYDMADEEGKIDVDPTTLEEGQLKDIVVYLDLGATVDGEIVWSEVEVDEDGNKLKTEAGEDVVTYTQEKTLSGKGSSVVLSVDEEDLEGYTHIKIGIKTKHGIYETVTEGEGEEATTTKNLVGNTAMASVYFADLEITQSEVVLAPVPPTIPERPTTDPAQDDVYDVILPPEADEANWFGKPYGAWMAGSNEKYYLSDMTYLQSCNTPNKNYAFGQPTTVGYPYSTTAGTLFLFGAEGMEHDVEKGIGMHPKNPSQPMFDRTDSWTVYDISEYTAAGADTFYALVGLTATSNEWGSRLTSAGVYVYIYGDKTGTGQNYELLAASELVKGYNIGEFNVNVEGVKLLLIDVILPETATSHGYSGVGLGNACLFTADENAVKPDYTGDYVPEEEDDGTDDAATTTPKVTTTPAADDDGGKKKGCGGVVTGAAGILFATVIAGAACFAKRRDEE